MNLKISRFPINYFVGVYLKQKLWGKKIKNITDLFKKYALKQILREFPQELI